MPDVFISYSRKDIDFAQKLTERLAETGRDIWVDWEDIARGADWLHEIYAGIESSDTFVFIVSEHSLTSEICNQEIKHARQHQKRIISVILRDITKDTQLEQYVKAHWFDAAWIQLAQENWKTLGQSNWLFFNADDKFDHEFEVLIDALETDLEYLKVHTRLLLRALEWEAAGKSSSSLLKDEEIDSAEAWLKSGIDENKQPTPTELHSLYITASRQRDLDEKQRLKELIDARKASEEQAEIARQEREQATQQVEVAQKASHRSGRLAVMAGVATVIAIIIGVIAGMQAVDAQSQVELAIVAQSNAEIQAELAILAQNDAQAQAELAATSEANALIEADVASTQIAIAGETLTPIPKTLEAVQNDIDSYQMAGQARLNEGNDKELVYAFKAISNEDPPGDVQSTFYDIASHSNNRITLSGHELFINSVVFSPDGKTFASASDDQTIKLWDVASGEVLNTFSGHEAFVNSVVFSPDGNIIASASGDQTIKLWDVASGDILATLSGHEGWVSSVVFSPDGNVIASASDDQMIKLWDVTSREMLATLTGHLAAVRSVAFSPDGAIIASASDDQTIQLWDVESGNLLDTFIGHEAFINSVVFSPDGKTLASTSGDQTIKLWNLTDTQDVVTLGGHEAGVNSVMFSPDGTIIASASGDQTIKLWSVASGDVLDTLTGHTSVVSSAVFSPDGYTIISASCALIDNDNTCTQGEIKLWDVANAQDRTTFSGHEDGVLGVTFSPDGKILASASADQTINLWDVTSGDILATLSGHSDQIWDVAFSPDGTTLASASFDQTIKLWNITDAQEIITLTGHSSFVLNVVFSPDGKTLASGSCAVQDYAGICSEGEIKLWDVANKQEIVTLNEHNNWIISIAFSPDGQTLASGSCAVQDDVGACSEGEIKLWDVANTQEITILSAIPSPFS
jgi:WD40 repeat protein